MYGAVFALKAVTCARSAQSYSSNCIAGLNCIPGFLGSGERRNICLPIVQKYL